MISREIGRRLIERKAIDVDIRHKPPEVLRGDADLDPVVQLVRCALHLIPSSGVIMTFRYRQGEQDIVTLSNPASHRIMPGVARTAKRRTGAKGRGEERAG